MPFDNLFNGYHKCINFHSGRLFLERFDYEFGIIFKVQKALLFVCIVAHNKLFVTIVYHRTAIMVVCFKHLLKWAFFNLHAIDS